MPPKNAGATPPEPDAKGTPSKDPTVTESTGGSYPALVEGDEVDAPRPTVADVLLLQESIDELLIRAEAAARSAAVSAAEASEARDAAQTARSSVRTYAGQVKGYTARAEQALEQVVPIFQGVREHALVCARHVETCEATARSLVSEVSDVLEHPALRRVVGAALERAARRLGILPEAHTPPPRRIRRFAGRRITEES